MTVMSSKYKRVCFVVSCLLSVWAVGIGLRFVLSGVLIHRFGWRFIYSFPLFDVVFDWAVLMLLGLMMWMLLIYGQYIGKKRNVDAV